LRGKFKKYKEVFEYVLGKKTKKPKKLEKFKENP